MNFSSMEVELHQEGLGQKTGLIIQRFLRPIANLIFFPQPQFFATPGRAQLYYSFYSIQLRLIILATTPNPEKDRQSQCQLPITEYVLHATHFVT